MEKEPGLVFLCSAATCIPSPTNQKQAGRNVLEKYPDTQGSLGIVSSLEAKVK
jgi:predicted alternative tryptophan synthase beta-subunit